MIFDIRKKKKSQKKFSLNIVVEIPADVINRIQLTILRSNIEEGGKFIGNIYQNKKKLIVKVDSYIDSGPNVKNSRTYLFPNGEYQENVFRLVESFEPEIEHIGSWHSHHCNKLNTLSEGDIIGYQKSVNNPDYNLDYYFVLLVTGIKNNELKLKYYIFLRRSENYLELSDNNIRIIPKKYRYEKLIRCAEDVSFEGRSFSNNNHYKEIHTSEFENSHDQLKAERAKDHQWLLQKYQSVTTFQKKNLGIIFWKWTVPLNNDHLEVRYTHPQHIRGRNVKSANIEIKYKDTKILKESIPLDEERFIIIENCIKKAYKYAKKKFR